jgi:pimeloyl-ACP methyl ester carboxylesterase
LRRDLAVVAATLLLAGLLSAEAVPTPVPRPQHAATSAQPEHGRVFLLRGLINVFSFGMDRLARKLEAKGIPSRVTNFTHWREFGVLLASQYRTDKTIPPVVIIGHSLGADSAVDMANLLAERGVPVRLVVAFDGVNNGHVVGKGIDEVINYYLSNGYGKKIEASAEFSGTLANIDLSEREEIDHLNIDKSASLHDEVLAKVTKIFAETP